MTKYERSVRYAIKTYRDILADIKLTKDTRAFLQYEIARLEKELTVWDSSL